MAIHEGMLSSLGQYAFNPEYADLVAIVRDTPRESDLATTASSIRAQDILPIKSFDLKLGQESVGERHAGEGADPNAIEVGIATLSVNITMPLLAPCLGWIDPAFGALYDSARFAYWGTPTAAMALLTSGGTLSSGATTLAIDNVADFAALTTPFSLDIIAAPTSGETSETKTVTTVNKAARTLTLSSATAHAHNTATTYVASRPSVGGAGPTREPSFSLFSTREGMLSPCLVNKLTIDARASGSVIITAELLAHRVIRERQIGLATALPTLLTNFSRLNPARVVHGLGVSLSSVVDGDTDAFGLATAVGHDLFGGFQGLRLPPSYVEGISLTIDNKLRAVHSSHSLWASSTRQSENSYPFAIGSEGRTVTGRIDYRCPVNGWAVMERLAGPSAINNGGLLINYGPCSLSLDEVAWKPSQSTGEIGSPQKRSVEFQLVSEGFASLPELAFAVQT